MIRLFKVSFIGLLVGLLTLINLPFNVNLYINSLVREINKRAILWYSGRGMESLPGDNFVVFYHEVGDAKRDARIVLDAAERFYPSLASAFEADVQSTTPVILYRDVGDLNRSFGWPANAGTMGVYWAGAIRVLTPEAWIETEREAEISALFAESGPMAHEIAHLFIDQIARGNCPRWFNEGVAQYQEYRLTGFNFGEAETFPVELAYTLDELDSFNALDDQNRAYHQSFSMVTCLAETRGWGTVLDLLTELGSGKSFDEAMMIVAGSDTVQFYQDWRTWVESQ